MLRINVSLAGILAVVVLWFAWWAGSPSLREAVIWRLTREAVATIDVAPATHPESYELRSE